jgi:hypothetical protein
MMEIPLSQVSVILIATSSILLDRCLRYTTTSSVGGMQDRLQLQVWLWLAVALSLYPNDDTNANNANNNDNDNEDEYLTLFHSWIHVVLFSNICSISVVALSSERLVRRNVTQHNPIASLLSPAAWLAMMSTLVLGPTHTTDALWRLSAQVFVISLAILWTLQWNQRRRRKVMAHEWQGIPNRTNSQSTGMCLRSTTPSDETVWYTWTVSNTLQWISNHVFVDDDDNVNDNDNNNDNQEEQDLVLSILAPHRISGDVLDTLTVSQLVHQLKLPYGSACRLAHAIQRRLVLVHPKPRGLYYPTTDTPTTTQDDGYGMESSSQPPDWLTLHDQEYNDTYHRPPPITTAPTTTNYPPPPPPPPAHYSAFQPPEAPPPPDSLQPTPYSAADLYLATQQQQQQPPPPPPTRELPSMDPEQEQRLEAMMRERYGLELPKLRTSTTSVEPDAVPLTTSRSSPQEDSIPRNGTHRSNTTTNNNAAVPEDWNTMPVAETFAAAPAPLDQEQEDSSSLEDSIPFELLEGMPPQVQEIAKRRPDLIRQLLLQQKVAAEQVGVISQQQQQQQGATTSDDEDGDLNDETTSLIQQPIRRPKYKSIDGHGHGNR